MAAQNIGNFEVDVLPDFRKFQAEAKAFAKTVDIEIPVEFVVRPQAIAALKAKTAALMRTGVDLKINPDLNEKALALEMAKVRAAAASTSTSLGRAFSVNNLERFKTSLRGIRDDLSALDSFASRVFRTMALGFGGLVVAATAAFGVIAAVGISKFAELEDGANKASQVFASNFAGERIAKGLNTTAAQISKFNVEVRNQIIETARTVGIETAFSAAEIAEGIRAMAQAGVPLQVSLDSISTAAKLAQTEGLDLVEVSDRLTSAFLASGGSIKTFGTDIKVFSDQIAFASDASQTSIDDLTKALTNKSAASFAQAGQDFSETINALNLLARVGVTGLKAGTALDIASRDILTKSADPEFADAWKRYGIEVRNAKGEMNSFADIADQFFTAMQKKTGNFTKGNAQEFRAELGLQQKSFGSVQALAQGVRAVREEGSSARGELNKLYEQSGGRLAVKAQLALDTFTQRFQQFRENISRTLSIFGQPAAETFSRFFEDLNKKGRDGESAFDRLNKKAAEFGKSFNKNLQVFLGQMQGPEGAAMFSGIAAGLEGILTGVKGFFVELAAAFSNGETRGKSFLVVVGELSRSFGNFAREVLPRVGEAIGNALRWIQENPDTIKQIGKSFITLLVVSKSLRLVILPLASALTHVFRGLSKIGSLFDGKGGGLIGKFPILSRALQVFRAAVAGVSAVAAALGTTFAVAFGVIAGLVISVIGAFRALGQSWDQYGGGIKDSLVELGKQFGLTDKSIQKIRDSLKELWPAIKNVVGALVEGATGFSKMFSDVLMVAIRTVIDLVRVLVAVLTGDGDSLKSAAIQLGKDFVNLLLIPIKESFLLLLEPIDQALGLLGQGELLDPAIDAIKGFGFSVDDASEKSGKGFKNITGWIDAVNEELGETSDATEKVTGNFLHVATSGEGAARRTWEAWKTASHGINVQITAAQEKFFSFYKGVATESGKLGGTFKRTFKTWETATRGLTGVGRTAGRDAGAALREGLEDELPGLKKSAERLLDSAFGDPIHKSFKSWEDATRGLTGVGRTAGRNAGEALRAGLEEAQPVIKASADKLVDDAATIPIKRTFKTWETGSRGLTLRSRKFGKDIGDALSEGIDESAPAIKQSGEKLIRDVVEGSASTVESASATLKTHAHTIVQSFKTQLTKEEESLRATKVFDALRGKITQFKDGAKSDLQIIATDVGQLGKTMQKIKEAANTVIKALRTSIGRQAPALARKLADMVLSLGMVAIRNVRVIIPQLLAAGALITTTISQGIALQVFIIAQAVKTSGMLMMAFFASGMKTGATFFVFPLIPKVTKRVNDLLSNGRVGAFLAGMAVMNGFYSGLNLVYEFKVKPLIREVADWIRANKGPISYDQQLLRPAGEAIMEGFHRGLNDGFGEIKGWVREVGPYVADLINDDMFFKQSANFLIGNAKADLAFDPNKEFENLLPDIPLGLHPTAGAADTAAQAKILADYYNAVIYSLMRPGAITSSGNVSQHALGQAADMGPPGPVTERMAKNLSLLIDKVFKQVIWANSLWRGGKSGFGYVGSHMDHIHLGWVPKRAQGGQVSPGTIYKVNERGEEFMIPSSRGTVMNAGEWRDVVTWIRNTAQANNVAEVSGGASKIVYQTIQSNATDPAAVAAVINMYEKAEVSQIQRN